MCERYLLLRDFYCRYIHWLNRPFLGTSVCASLADEDNVFLGVFFFFFNL